MKRAATAFCAAVIALVSVSVFAQTVPSFAGKWTLVPDPTAPAGGGRGMGGLGDTATIVQDATSLTITRTTQMGEITSTYKLDGSDSKNTLNMAGNAIDMISKVKTDGGTLVVTTSMNFNGNPVESTMTLSLDAAGNLVVQSTRPDFQGGGAPITTKMTYKKN
jgi:hypothetical protein